MKNRLLLLLRTSLFILMVLMLSTNCRKDDASSNDGVVAVFDTVLSNTGVLAKVNYQDKITIEIPAGTIPSGTKLTIKTLAEGYLSESSMLDVGAGFDVSLSSGSTFDQPLKITMPYEKDPSLPVFLQHKYMIGYYDENIKAWKAFKYPEVDTANRKVSILTNHLTKLGRISAKRALGYDSWASSPHFYVYWKESGIPSRSEYHSPNGFDDLLDPPYISDILYYLERGWDYFKSKDYPLTSGKIDVYIHNIGGSGSEGEYTPGFSLQGAININERIPADKGLTLQQQLPKTCVHEFMHYCQDFYYVYSVGKVTRWWWEATAPQADRMVFPASSPYEADMFAMNYINDNLGKSWDEFGTGDESFYGASGFFSYLAYYKSGTRIDLHKLVKESGEGISYYRTFLDTYLRSIGCSGIGEEYRNYLRWVYESTGPISLPEQEPSTTTTIPYAYCFFANGDMKTRNFKSNVDYLSLRMIKFMGNDTASRSFRIKNNSKDSEIECYVYLVCRTVGEQSRTMVKQLKTGEEYILDLPGSRKYYCDIININTSRDNDLPFDCDVTEVIHANFSGISIGYGISYVMTDQIVGGNYTNIENENFYDVTLDWQGLSGNFHELIGEDEVSGYVRLSSSGDKLESFSIQVKNFYGQPNEYMVGYTMSNVPGSMQGNTFHDLLSLNNALNYVTDKTGYAGPTQGYKLTQINSLQNWYVSIH